MNKINTGFSDVDYLLSELVSGLKALLKDNLLGIYLYGSLVWGDFDHAASDVDIFIALNDELTTKDFDVLDLFHAVLIQRFSAWNDRIEIAYASQITLKNIKNKIGKIAVISPGEPFHIKNAGTYWLINYYLLQNKSIILYGSSPKLIIAPISNNEFVAQVKKQAIEWQDWIVHTKKSLGYQYYAVLTLCRAMYVIYKHEQGSKLKAGAWAKNQFPKWQTLIQKSLTKAELNDASHDLINKTYQEVTAFVAEMVQHIQERE